MAAPAENPGILKKELSNMGAVYVIVVLVIVAVLAFTLIPKEPPAVPVSTVDIIGGPPQTE